MTVAGGRGLTGKHSPSRPVRPWDLAFGSEHAFLWAPGRGQGAEAFSCGDASRASSPTWPGVPIHWAGGEGFHSPWRGSVPAGGWLGLGRSRAVLTHAACPLLAGGPRGKTSASTLPPWACFSPENTPRRGPVKGAGCVVATAAPAVSCGAGPPHADTHHQSSPGSGARAEGTSRD